MKWVNPGLLPLFNTYTNVEQVDINKSPNDGQKNVLNLLGVDTGVMIGGMDDDGRFTFSNVAENTTELWCSFSFARWGGYNTEGHSIQVHFSATLPYLHIERDGEMTVRDSKNNIIYTPNVTIGEWSDTKHDIEVHIKTGGSGRIDVWHNTKLLFSYRSPSVFTGTVAYVQIYGYTWARYGRIMFSSFIIQDTRRIGLEKFKKLTIDPATEQNMPQGSTTTFKLSGLSDATEFSDITSVCAVLQATSRDTNITTGTFTLEGANVGTIDVSDSSGKAYELAQAETNSLTGKPWTRDDIEGKTLSFKVNGAE